MGTNNRNRILCHTGSELLVQADFRAVHYDGTTVKAESGRFDVALDYDGTIDDTVLLHGPLFAYVVMSRMLIGEFGLKFAPRGFDAVRINLICEQVASQSLAEPDSWQRIEDRLKEEEGIDLSEHPLTIDGRIEERENALVALQSEPGRITSFIPTVKLAKAAGAAGSCVVIVSGSTLKVVRSGIERNGLSEVVSERYVCGGKHPEKHDGKPSWQPYRIARQLFRDFHESRLTSSVASVAGVSGELRHARSSDANPIQHDAYRSAMALEDGLGGVVSAVKNGFQVVVACIPADKVEDLHGRLQSVRDTMDERGFPYTSQVFVVHSWDEVRIDA